jgi:HSP20 family protein
MTITRYTRRSPFRSPWLEVEDMSNRLNRLFSSQDQSADSTAFPWVPTVNVEETTEELLLTAELPGLALEDISIEVENHKLTLSGEKKSARDEEDEDRKYHLWERRHGSFKRTFNLPRTVKTDEITAYAKDGILSVRMPKSPEAKSRKIEVRSES